MSSVANKHSLIDEVWDAVGHFVEKMFGEASKEQMMCVLKAQSLNQKDEHECIKCLKFLSERIQNIYTTSAAKADAQLSSQASTSDEKNLSNTADTEDDVLPLSQLPVEAKPKAVIDENLVQILASKAEVERRIAAFIASKRSDVNDINRREFCFGLPNSEEENSCARVDSVFVSRAGSSSHVRVTRVFNTQGPQTQYNYTGETYNAANTEQCMEERLNNLEQHLNMDKDSKADMFSRLKALEERILFLEGLSPEYFKDGAPPPKRVQIYKAAASGEQTPQTKVKNEYESLSEIDQRIYALQARLREKMKHLSP